VKTPLDYLVSHDTFRGPFYIVAENKLSSTDFGISIGPQTEELFGEIIAQSETIFYNGLMGDLSHPETLEGVKSLFSQMAESRGYSVIGGGDSTAAAQLLGLSQKIDFLSTGGGALIAYLSNPHLPALEILTNK
jgi:phosphoglycerate kinase